MKPKVLCAGIAALDYRFGVDSFHGEPGKYFATSYGEYGGGPAGTASVAVSVLGGESWLWAELGKDSVGDRIVEDLVRRGVNTSLIERRPGVQSTVSSVYVDKNGERLIVNFRKSAERTEPLSLPLDLTGFKAVLGDVRWPAASAVAFAAARKLGIPTVLDGDMSSDGMLSTLVPLADHAAFSQKGLVSFTGEKDPEKGLRLAAAHCPGIVYVTLGECGSLWLEGDTLHSMPGFKVQVSDTTGAGDVFHGSMALAYAEGMPVREAVRFASAAAALKCEKDGGRDGIPDRARLEDFLKKN